MRYFGRVVLGVDQETSSERKLFCVGFHFLSYTHIFADHKHTLSTSHFSLCGARLYALQCWDIFMAKVLPKALPKSRQVNVNLLRAVKSCNQRPHSYAWNKKSCSSAAHVPLWPGHLPLHTDRAYKWIISSTYALNFKLSLKNIFKYLSNKVMSSKRLILGHFQRHFVRIICKLEIIIHLDEFKLNIWFVQFSKVLDMCIHLIKGVKAMHIP